MTMPTRRALRAVLGNFLGTYTSRYSAYRGFWLFGFLVERMQRIEINLLPNDSIAVEHPAFLRARELATGRFSDQLKKHGFEVSVISDAGLIVERLPDDGSLPGMHYRGGYNLHFTAFVTADTGKRFVKETSVFVAPHDPTIELASTFTR